MSEVSVDAELFDALIDLAALGAHYLIKDHSPDSMAGIIGAQLLDMVRVDFERQDIYCRTCGTTDTLSSTVHARCIKGEV